ncbi:MAG TPA: nuclear transport factor 2 family protein [Pyrinomonadaceae bacterium]|jgi:hypothetical protein
MRYQSLLFITILSFSIIFAACGGSQPVNNSTNNSAGNTNTVAANNSNSSLPTNKKPEAATANNAPTIAPVVTAYYEAWKKNDDAALKKVFSQETLKAFEADMKADKQTSLAKWMSTNETAPEKPFEVRNEKIEGDSAIAEIKGGSYAVWTPFKFVRENGEWKMTNQSPDFDDVKKSATESKPANANP